MQEGGQPLHEDEDGDGEAGPEHEGQHQQDGAPHTWRAEPDPQHHAPQHLRQFWCTHQQTHLNDDDGDDDDDDEDDDDGDDDDGDDGDDDDDDDDGDDDNDDDDDDVDNDDDNNTTPTTKQ